MRAEVAAACEFLGLDPLNVANEGKLVAVLAPEVADAVLAAMKAASARPRRGADRPRRRRRQSLRADAHRLRRRAHRRLAVGRAIAAHLLKEERAGEGGASPPDRKDIARARSPRAVSSRSRRGERSKGLGKGEYSRRQNRIRSWRNCVARRSARQYEFACRC